MSEEGVEGRYERRTREEPGRGGQGPLPNCPAGPWAEPWLGWAGPLQRCSRDQGSGGPGSGSGDMEQSWKAQAGHSMRILVTDACDPSTSTLDPGGQARIQKIPEGQGRAPGLATPRPDPTCSGAATGPRPAFMSCGAQVPAACCHPRFIHCLCKPERHARSHLPRASHSAWHTPEASRKICGLSEGSLPSLTSPPAVCRQARSASPDGGRASAPGARSGHFLTTWSTRTNRGPKLP